MRYRLILCASFVLALAAAGEASAPGASDPGLLLDRAFDKMFNYPSVRTVELRILRNGRIAGVRVFDVAYQKFDGLGRTILRFKAPEYLRDNALLMIETQSGDNDTWLYQPDEGRPRRVSAYQKADSFYGSDLSFEDLENRHWDHYDVRYAGTIEAGDRWFHVIEASPREYSRYSRIAIRVATDSLAIERIEFFRGEQTSPVKTIRVDLDRLVEEGDVFKPRAMRVEVAGRDWATEVLFKRIEISKGMTSRAFSTMRLQAGGEDLFHMVDRTSEQTGTESAGSQQRK